MYKINFYPILDIPPKEVAKFHIQVVSRWMVLIFFCVVTSMNVFSQNSINYSFQLPPFRITDTTLPAIYGNASRFKSIEVADEKYGFVDSVGFPLLPKLTVALQVPIDAYNFAVNITNAQYRTLSVNGRVLPCQDDWDVGSPTPIFQMNSPYYTSNGGLITARCAVTDSFSVMGQRGAEITLYPFLYNPRTSALQILMSADVTLSYQTSGTPQQEYAVPRPLESYMSKLFENYAPNKNAPTRSRYLIVTHPHFRQTVQYFADYKSNIGFDVDIVETSISPTPHEVYNIIQTQYSDMSTRPQFVLLVGGHDYIPAYEGHNSGDSIDQPISDFRYSTMDNTSWHADLFLGRFPANNNAELQNMINKTIFMEMNLHTYEKKATFIAGDDSRTITAGCYRWSFERGHDHVIDNAFTPRGYYSQKLYQPTRQECKSALNSNPLLYVYSGHGWMTHWSLHDSISLFTNFFTSANNNVLPLMFAFACRTGDFAFQNNIGANLLRATNGCVSYFGSSVSTYANSDFAIEKKLLGDAFFEERYLGTAISVAKDDYWRRFWSWANRTRTKRYMKSYNLLGDPSFNITGRGCLSDLILDNGHYLYDGDTMYYVANGRIETVSDFVMHPGSKAILTATTEIVFKPGTHIEQGAELLAQITDCVRDNAQPVQNKAHAQESPDLFEINQSSVYEQLKCSTYPNPAQNEVTITLENEGNFTVQIYNVLGRIEKTWEVANSRQFVAPLKDLTPGCYIVCIRQGLCIFHQTIIKQ